MVNKIEYLRPGERVEFGFLNLFLQNIKDSRRLIYSVTGVGTVIALIVLLLLPNQYTATVKIMPEASGSTTKLALMAGSLLPESVLSSAILSESGSEGDNLKALVKGSRVLDSVLNRNYTIDEAGTNMTLTGLWEIENIELARTHLLSKTRLNQNSKSGIFSISVETTDPSLSAQIANSFVNEVDQFKQEMDRGNAATSAEYLRGQIAEAEETLRVKEEEKTAFLNRNRNYLTSTDAALNSAVARLEREVVFYSGLVLRLRQLEATATMESERATPRLTVIEAAQPPLLKSGPARTMDLIMCMLASFLFPVGLIALKTSYGWYFPQATRSALSDSMTVVTGDVNRAINRVRKPFKTKETAGV